MGQLLSKKEGSENYQCKVIKVDAYKKHPEADRLYIITVDFQNVITGVEPTIGQLMCYFPVLSRINNSFLSSINAFSNPELNNDKTVKGFFGDKGRVKPIKLRGIPSEGYLHPVKDIESLYGVVLNEGDEFNTIGDTVFCSKYIVERQIRTNTPTNNKDKEPKVSRLVEGQFKFHNDTSNLRRNMEKISPTDLIEISYKKHGCLPGFQKVHMYDGTKKQIRNIKIGDVVAGFDHIKKSIVPSVVKNTFMNGKTNYWYRIKRECDFYNIGECKNYLYLTENHKVFIEGKGYVEAKNCAIGDMTQSMLNEIYIDNKRMSILEGLLMSDGYLDNHNTKYAIRWGAKKEHESYLNYISVLLGNLCTQHKRYRISGYGTEMVDMSSKSSVQITEHFKSWKIDGKVNLPDNFILDKYKLAFWYMGDGNLMFHKSQKDRASIAICSFSEESLIIINRELNKIGFSNFSIFKDKKGFNRIRFNHSDAKMLFGIICELIPDVMQYKLSEEYRNKFIMPVLDVQHHINVKVASKILEIDILNTEQVKKYSTKYDIETETNNFFASNLLIHNSSLVVSNILINKQLSTVSKIIKKLGFNIVDKEYDIIYSSRRVIKNQHINKNPNHYYKTDIWGDACNSIKDKIPKGYSFYCEILGYTKDGRMIQKDFDYGCQPGEFKVFVYKITHTTPDGFTINLTPNQIKQFCDKYDLNYSSTLFYYGYAKDLFKEIAIDDNWQENFLKSLEKTYTEKDCKMCINKVPEEGIVLIKENMFDYEAYKLKSFKFLQKEDKELEENSTNIEDEQ